MHLLILCRLPVFLFQKGLLALRFFELLLQLMLRVIEELLSAIQKELQVFGCGTNIRYELKMVSDQFRDLAISPCRR